jgi:hypothetical protein
MGIDLGSSVAQLSASHHADCCIDAEIVDYVSVIWNKASIAGSLRVSAVFVSLTISLRLRAAIISLPIPAPQLELH